MMSAMRAVAAAGATLEASPTAVWSAITTPIRAAVASAIRATICAPVTVAAATEGAVGTSLGASAASAETAAIAAAVASAALRALETGTRVGADAGKILSRRAGIARPTSFPWQENNVFFDDGFDCGAIRSGSRKRFRRDVLDGFVVSEVGAFGFGQLRAVFRVGPCFAALLMSFRVSGFGGELPLAGLGFCFRVFAILACFTLILLFFGLFVVAVLRVFGNFVRFMEGFRFIFVEFSAANEGIGFGARLGLFVLGFDETRGERNRLFIAEARGAVANRFGWSFFRVVVRNGGRSFLSGFRAGFRSTCFSFRFLIGEDPVRQAAREAPGRSRARLQTYDRARGRWIKIGLPLFGFVIAKRLNRSQWHGARSELGERFTR